MTKNRLLIIFLLVGQVCFAQNDKWRLPFLKTIYNVDGSKHGFNESLPKRGKILLVFYDPSCSHCQQFAQGIAENFNEFKNISVYFICMQDVAHIKGFINMFAKSLIGKGNVSFWRDPGTEFFEYFLPENYPATYLYDARSLKLIKAFQGDYEIAKMLPFFGY